MKKDKLEEEIKELHIKSLNRVYITYGTFRRFVDKIKLSQRKEDIEMFEKMIDECETLCECNTCKREMVGTKELKQKLKSEMKK